MWFKPIQIDPLMLWGKRANHSVHYDDYNRRRRRSVCVSHSHFLDYLKYNYCPKIKDIDPSRHLMWKYSPQHCLLSTKRNASYLSKHYMWVFWFEVYQLWFFQILRCKLYYWSRMLCSDDECVSLLSVGNKEIHILKTVIFMNSFKRTRILWSESSFLFSGP